MACTHGHPCTSGTVTTVLQKMKSNHLLRQAPLLRQSITAPEAMTHCPEDEPHKDHILIHLPLGTETVDLMSSLLATMIQVINMYLSRILVVHPVDDLKDHLTTGILVTILII